MLAVGVCTPASAGGGGALGAQPEMRGSYCGESDEAAPSRAGCARITGYIVAGQRFGSGERIGGPPDFFAPLNAPGIAGGDSDFKARAGQSFLPQLDPAAEAR